MKSKKLLSLLLAVIMIMSAVPMFASAADPIALTEANVVEWPTVDKELYYGQKAKYDITLIGGVVTADGTTNGAIIEGTWEFTDADDYFPAAGTRNANIRFIPSDSATYTGFEVKNSKIVLYKVNKPLPVLVDENDPPVATEVEAGAKLSTSTLSGGQVKNPYNAEEPKALAGFWRWTTTTTVVNESGYYQARMVLANYEILYMDVWVQIASEIAETSIIEYPTIPELTYNPNVTWADIELTGGKAVIKGTDTQVEGTFAIKDTRLSGIPNPNFTQIEVVFTPANAEEALPVEFAIPVKVNPAPISFIDSEGSFVVDGFVFEADPGTLMRDIQSYLMAYLNCPPQSVISVEDKNSYAQNDRTYKLTVIHDNPNYTGSELYFTVVFKDVELTPVIASAGYNEYKVDCGSYRPDGTFTVSCNGEEIAEVKAGQPFDCVVYTDDGGTYEITAKYNPTENDYFIVSDASYSITVNPARNIKTVSGMHFTVNGSQTYNAIRTGDVIELTYNMPEFAYYVVKDGSGKTVTLEGVDLTSKTIKFTMPDYDLSFSVKTPAQLEQEEATANCDHFCHSDNILLQMLWKLINFFCQLFGIEQYCDCGAAHYEAPIFG